MGRSHREFNFEDDMELMNLEYQMKTGNFINFEELPNNLEEENPLNTYLKNEKNML